MIELILDIGNTDLVLGYWLSGEKDPKLYRLKTKSILAPRHLDQFFEQINYDLGAENKPVSITISSVVPTVNEILTDYLFLKYNCKANFLNRKSYPLLPIEILQPDQIGTDLVANALAAHTFYKSDSIIVDFGTALSFTTIDKFGKIIGVSIAPGINTALKSLTSNTAQLFEVKIEQPRSALGQDTEHAIQSGITYGYDGLVRGIIAAQEKELHTRLHVIFTGGLSKIIYTLQDRVDDYKPFLTLEGIKIAGEWMRKSTR